MTLVDTRTPDPQKFIKGATGDWEIVMGLEVHAQVSSEAKLFSGSSTQFGGEQNNHCLLYTSPSPRDLSTSRMPSSA